MKLVTAVLALLFNTAAHAEDIAACSNPAGKGYFPEIGLVNKEDSGWEEEKITGESPNSPSSARTSTTYCS